MITYRNLFKDKDSTIFHNEFTAKDKQDAINKAFNNIQKMRDSGYSFIKTMRNTNGHWHRVWLETPTGLDKTDNIINDLERLIDEWD